MATIGGVYCDIIRGLPRFNTERVETWQLAGIDGYGAMSMGLGKSEKQLTLILFGTNAAVETWASLIEGLAGSDPVNIEDDFGDTYNDFLVVAVSNRIKSPAMYAAGTAADLRCSIPINIVQPA